MPTSNYIGRTGVGQLVERAVTYYTFLQNSKSGSGGGELSSWGSAYISPSFLGWKIYSSIPDIFIYLVNYSLGFRLGKSICNSGGNLVMAPVTTTHPNFFYIHLLCRQDQGVAASEKCVSHPFSPASALLCRGSAQGDSQNPHRLATLCPCQHPNLSGLDCWAIYLPGNHLK